MQHYAKANKQIDRQTDEHAERQTDKKAGRHTDHHKM